MDQKTALELFEYRDGKLYWRINRSNGVRKGDLAGCRSTKYVQLKLKGKTYYEHQIVFLMHNAYIPEEVDHIDADKHNNNIENLRAATRLQNSLNMPRRADNKSGHKNVCWHAAANKWQVSVKANGKRMNFGLFEDLELAALVASEARDKYHGEFARVA
jgi:hypothetical protein